MTREEAIKQLEILWEYCESMMSSDEPVWRRDCDALKIAISSLRPISREQGEKVYDEAVQCIREIAKSGKVWMCPYCVHAKDTTGGIAECELDIGVCMMPYSRFEWRGQKKE